MSAANEPLAAREELLALLATIYTPEGVTVWLADAARKGLTLDEQYAWALAAAEGTFV